MLQQLQGMKCRLLVPQNETRECKLPYKLMTFSIQNAKTYANWVTYYKSLDQTYVKGGKMQTTFSGLLAILVLSACGGTYNDTGNVPPPSGIQLASSMLDQSKYVGGWASCTALQNGQFYGNHITFTAGNGDLIFAPAIGLVGNYTDAACTQAVPGSVVGITPILIHFVPATTVSIMQQPNPLYFGTADSLPDMTVDAFKFIAFSLDYKTLYASTTNAFNTVVVYHKL